ncbi:MAG: hydrogenase iron-sulfur subunit [Candidatus Methanomethylophilus sp.]|jgi:coenzyme F420-reducing hydrogenase delta subunit|nr:hydrogenase iron-sulfur subunit [Methanomethylophilus sp.]MBQ5448269.1 hydrogenase iron-sulfur subunit [Methanomethylophilus sp.]
MADNFEPLIVTFCCNWCSYAGADNAGVGRRQMPPNFRIIRTMCSARIDPEFILRALSKGADGVMVLGCHPADCHYIGGNYRARRRIALIRLVLEQYGFDPKRLLLQWVSASEGEKFQKTVVEFVDTIKALGPTPVKSKKQKDMLTNAVAIKEE